MLNYTIRPVSVKMKHMERDELVKVLCAPYCSFFRPGKDEELACNGFSVLMKLAASGLEIGVRPEKRDLQEKTEKDLFDAMCSRCPFFKEDCDYASWQRGELAARLRKEVNPCGGFFFLGLCIEHGSMDIQVVNRVI